ncbi:MATE family efflux transporter [Georgenia sp. Z1344]|uniref:MATE family efflux transporter n=1 Tax=Georgenia sp. Z1344 TaxID=3416706 RepID=UPI003CF25C38
MSADPGSGVGPEMTPREVDRQILRLALPALGALIAEPLLLIIDSAMVGHLGTASLAGLAIAQAVLTTIVGVCVFLAYATTAATARLVGAGQRGRGIRAGIDGMWLAVGLGVVLAVVLLLAGPWLVGALGGSGEVASEAVAYLRASAFGLPGMLVVLAATGTLRGLLDTRTPLYVAAGGAVANAVLNAILIYGAGLGIVGSGLGTAIAQLGMGAALAAVVVRGARRHDVPLAPSGLGVLASARAGLPLFVRTLSLRAAILVTVAVATALGPARLAAYQVTSSIWSLCAFALDAVAIAAQALVGQGLGRGDAGAVRRLVGRCLRWGILAGIVIGIVVAASSPLLVRIFSADPDVRSAAVWCLVVVGALMGLAGLVYILDGILMGAGDGPFLAVSGIVTLVVYLPAAWAVAAFGPGGTWGLVWLWVAFAGVFMGARAVTTYLRSRGTRWMVLGEGR